MHQSRQHRLQVRSSIESIRELGQIAVPVLLERKGVIGTRQRSLQVRQQRIDPLKLRMLCRFRAVPRNVRLMALHEAR